MTCEGTYHLASLLRSSYVFSVFQVILNAEKDMLINELINTKAKEDPRYCNNQFIDMMMCQQNYNFISQLWYCDPEIKVHHLNSRVHTLSHA